MTTAGEGPSIPSPHGLAPSWPDKLWASLAATSGMLLVPCSYLALETYGPSSRVVFYEYLPFLETWNLLLAGVLGVWLGVRVFRSFRPHFHFSGSRLMAGCLLGFVSGFAVVGICSFIAIGDHPAVAIAGAVMVPALGAWWCGAAWLRLRDHAMPGRYGRLRLCIAASIAVWLVYPQLIAFPSGGSIADREQWSRLHIRQYPALMRTVEGIPLIEESIGRVSAIAPVAGVQHVIGQDMDGIVMRLVLEVKGEHGAGTLRVDCRIDGDEVPYWQPATWTKDGKSTEIATVPNQVWRR